jgi:DNA-binding response OmpR family regulator
MISPTDPRVLIIDDDGSADATLRALLLEAGLNVATARDGLAAIQGLSENEFAAVVLNPMIRNGLNGFAVLNYIEQDKPELLPRVFLFTPLSKETIARTAPALLPRFFRKPSEGEALAVALISFCGAERPQGDGQKRAVLVVEDDAKTAALETEMLREMGYSCRWMPRGADVLEALQSPRFDAIVLDLILPDVDGFRILQTLRAAKPELLKRIIVVTGMPDRYLAAIDRQQICGILHKPIDVGELAALVAKCCQIGETRAAG